MKWVSRYEGGSLVTRREPVRPVSDLVFDEWRFTTNNPTRDLTIRSTSTGRDDFSHACFRLSDNERLFTFEMGRPYGRAMTDEEKVAHPHWRDACVFLIVDRWISEEQRQLVAEWLQAEKDGIAVSLRQAGKPREQQLVLLESVSHIEGY
jgi:hypothetical protein